MIRNWPESVTNLAQTAGLYCSETSASCDQGHQALEDPPGDGLAMLTVVVVGPGSAIDRYVSEDVVDHPQQGVGYCHDGFLRPAMS
jgi:hypothetical protein